MKIRLLDSAQNKNDNKDLLPQRPLPARLVASAVLRLARAQQGSVAIIIAVSLLTIVVGAGVAIDMARAQSLHTQVQAALDTAGLAALNAVGSSATPLTQTTALPVAQAVATKYFWSNFPNGDAGTANVTPTVTSISPDLSTLNLTASATQSTLFLNMVGISNVSVAAASQVTRGSTGQGMEVVLVLDNTGSMNNAPPGDSTPKIQSLVTAADAFLDLIYGASNDTVDGLYTAVVPFSQTVNIGTQNKAFLSWTEFDSCDDDCASSYGNNGIPGQEITGNQWVSYGNQIAGPYDMTGGSNFYTPGYVSGSLPGEGSLLYWGPGNAGWGGCVIERSLITSLSDTAYNSWDWFHTYWFPPEGVPIFYGQSGASWVPGYGYPFQVNPDQLTNRYGGYWNYNVYPVNDATAYRVPGWESGTITNRVATYTANGALDTINQGPNLSCPAPLSPLNASKQVAKNVISSMVATGDTLINEGLVWGWRVISPNWKGKWIDQSGNTNTSLPLPYNSGYSKKVVILMTDGWNHWVPYNFTAYGWLWTFVDVAIGGLPDHYGSSTSTLYTMLGLTPANILPAGSTASGSPCWENSPSTCNNDEINAETLLNTFTKYECDQMKADGIIIYTVGFGPPGVPNPDGTAPDDGSVNEPLLEYCATSPAVDPNPKNQHYFNTSNGTNIIQAFQQIANQLIELRVSQ